MIIGRKFAWAHIPRTGGEITAELFRFVNGRLGGRLISGNPPIKGHAIHDTFLNIETETYALNIRQLPEFIMSWIIMCAGKLREEEERCFKGGIWPEYNTRLPVPTKRQLLDLAEPYGPAFFAEYYGGNFASLPDFLLNRYRGIRKIDCWLRLEHLKEDFINFVSSLEPLTEEIAEEVIAYQYTVKRPFIYNHDSSDFFSPDEIERLYTNNPLWADIERAVYPE